MDGGNWKEMFNAACAGDLELVKYHVSRGVDINFAHPEFLSTPLVACALAGQEEVALFLLASGAQPDLYSEFDGLTPAQAARNMNLPTLEAKLLEAGAAVPVDAGPRLALGGLWRLFGRRATGS
jgi:uncharacterized protein